MPESTKPSTAKPATSTLTPRPSPPPSEPRSFSSEASKTRGNFDREAQQKEIAEALQAEAEHARQVQKDMRDGKITSLEGARPAYEPEPGYSVGMPSPGSIPGGPVPEADEFAEYSDEEKEFWQGRQKDGNKLVVDMEK